MEILLLLLLVISVAVLYLPSIMKERALDSPLDTVSDFRRGMLALASSTRNPKARVGRRYNYGQNETEPYFRKSQYEQRGYDDDRGEEDDFVPYPSNKSQVHMETRRQRIMAAMLVLALGTGILALVPKLRWMLPLHVVVLVLLTTYVLLVVFLPYYEQRYR